MKAKKLPLYIGILSIFTIFTSLTATADIIQCDGSPIPEGSFCKFTFEPPRRDTTFEFTDVTRDSQYSDAIYYLWSWEKIDGYEDGSFRPYEKINRAEFIKLIASGTPSVSRFKECFPDVQTEWFAPYICFLHEWGEVHGNPDGLFHPERNINKAEALKLIIEPENNDYAIVEPWYVHEESTDIAKDTWYSKYLQTALDLEMIDIIDQKLDPAHEVTRGEVAEILYRKEMWKEKQFLDRDPEFLSLVEELQYGKASTYSYDNFHIVCEQEYYDLLKEIYWLVQYDSHVYSSSFARIQMMTELLYGINPYDVAINSGCSEISEQYLDIADRPNLATAKYKPFRLDGN